MPIVTGTNTFYADELRASCSQCGLERLVAYWDPELEHYIYWVDLNPNTDTFLCECCQMCEAQRPKTMAIA